MALAGGHGSDESPPASSHPENVVKSECFHFRRATSELGRTHIQFDEALSCVETVNTGPSCHTSQGFSGLAFALVSNKLCIVYWN
jgi:hypothetical protein